MTDLNVYFLCSAVFLSALLTIGFIRIFVKYNKDKVLPIIAISQKELLETYGSVVCACIIQKRQTSPKDVVSAIVQMAQNGVISISKKRTSEDGIIINSYTLKYVDKKYELNDYEKDIVEAIFKDGDESNLNSILKNSKGIFKKFKSNLDEKMNSLGINTVKVPKKVRNKNNLFFVLVCLFFALHLSYDFIRTSSFSDVMVNLTNWIVILVKIDALVILTVLLIKVISLVFERFRTKNNYEKIKIADSILVKMFLKFLLSNVIVLVFLLFAGNNMYFIADIILFDIAMVSMLSDELFVSHSPRINKVYMSLRKYQEALRSRSLIDYIDAEKASDLKLCIPMIISLNDEEINYLEYLQKVIDISLDENEQTKYKILLDIMELNETEIRKFYFKSEL